MEAIPAPEVPLQRAAEAEGEGELAA
uniref:Uncharacterized protein n=1 Tax=Arundo donax TaxID=35708 RepID=A0A0A9B601_ARUDO